ncbi:MAG: NAD-dependent epimerase/dehydratase family protein [Candidatus Heimdallarchaeota archaeon]|nr:NAD-dependent epimerase/dehydratase family protein [Candidatus Heimdallarchaeota archaeon]MCK4876604.1 NAD-dependent epimerase/dehydratase family protein [Candidatus Heimdallarchaeota archaeon]
MKVLILGGTHFLGRHFVEQALNLGYEVSIFNRGKSNKNLFPEVEKLVGDRKKGDLDSLKGRNWDCVIDTIGYMKNLDQVVEESTQLLKDKAEHYTFISSIEAYSEVKPNFDESTPTRLDEKKTLATRYGVNKALAEKIVTDTFGSKGLNIRAGLIVGKYDKTNRFSYWVARIAKGGEVLTPVGPEYPIQIIDAADIARWIFKMISHGKGGDYNVTGPDYKLTIGQILETCKEVSGSDAEFTWVSNEFLLKNKLGQWREIPFWSSNEQLLYMVNSCNVEKAIKAGLEFRLLKDTIEDILEWEKIAPTKYNYKFAGGLNPKKEQKLLQKWNEEKN